jgi:hypothetical protein
LSPFDFICSIEIHYGKQATDNKFLSIVACKIDRLPAKPALSYNLINIHDTFLNSAGYACLINPGLKLLKI